MSLHGDRISRERRRRIAEHPDPFRTMVDRKVWISVDGLEEAYGQPRTAPGSAADPNVRAAVAQAWYDRPVAVQVGLLSDPDPQVRVAAITQGQPGVPPEWRERWICRFVVLPPAGQTVPPEVLEGLVREHGDVFHIQPLLIDRPNFPRRRLRPFVHEQEPNVRYVALQDPELPVPDLQRFSVAAEPFLRRGVARHPNITVALLERLLSDPDPQVADDAAANPALRPTRMYRILTAAGL